MSSGADIYLAGSGMISTSASLIHGGINFIPMSASLTKLGCVNFYPTMMIVGQYSTLFTQCILEVLFDFPLSYKIPHKILRRFASFTIHHFPKIKR